jgi:hypothetical protein
MPAPAQPERTFTLAELAELCGLPSTVVKRSVEELVNVSACTSPARSAASSPSTSASVGATAA